MTARSNALRQAVESSGLSAGERELTLLSRYLDLLLLWNRRINLTGSKDESTLITQHLADSMPVVGHLPASSCRLVDVGAGGGLPGIVIAIFRPDLSATLLEPTHKKHAFLSTAARDLGLPNLKPFAERLEQHLGRADFQPYDVAVSRATWAVPEWLSRAHWVVRPGGLILAMEGHEQHVLPEGTTRHPYALGDSTRAILRQVRLA